MESIILHLIIGFDVIGYKKTKFIDSKIHFQHGQIETLVKVLPLFDSFVK